jgi:ferredoxin-NADP reductase
MSFGNGLSCFLSISSTPAELERSGLIYVLVRLTKYPPIVWLFNEATPGTPIQVSGLGEVVWDPLKTTDAPEHLILVAGGIGIAPLLSIFNSFRERHPGVPVDFLFSIRTVSELSVAKDILNTPSNISIVRIQVFITNDDSPVENLSIPIPIVRRRIVLDDVDRVMMKPCTSQALCFVCGPKTLSQDAFKWLKWTGFSGYSKCGFW